jgi:hypothetical protein
MTATVFVHTRNSAKGRWSRYVFPFSIDAFAQLADDLYIRSGDTIKRVSEAAVTDIHNGATIGFTGSVQWPWLDCGQAGATKMLEGFDLVAAGTPSVSIGYDQRNLSTFTDPYTVDPDTVTGDIIPLPVSGASFSLKVDFAAGERWNLWSALLYVHDNQAAT